MPTFDAPDPITVTIEVPFANVHVIASERTDAVITVLPTEPERSGSLRAVQDVKVDQLGGSITVTYPGSWKQYVRPFSAGTADISVELPEGSVLHAKAGTVRTEGHLGAADITLAGGEARVQSVDRLALTVSAGSAVIDRISGTASIKVSAGSLRIGRITGRATARVPNGTTTVDQVTGTLELLGANGDMTVRYLDGQLEARSSHADIRLDRLQGGDATLTTTFGSLEVGVPEGTATHVDLTTEHGTVRNLLTPTDGPVPHAATARLRAGTRYGDIMIQRPTHL